MRIILRIGARSNTYPPTRSNTYLAQSSMMGLTLSSARGKFVKLGFLIQKLFSTSCMMNYGVGIVDVPKNNVYAGIGSVSRSMCFIFLEILK